MEGKDRHDARVTAEIVGAIALLDVPDLHRVIAATRSNQGSRAANQTWHHDQEREHSKEARIKAEL